MMTLHPSPLSDALPREIARMIADTDTRALRREAFVPEDPDEADRDWDAHPDDDTARRADDRIMTPLALALIAIGLIALAALALNGAA